MSMPPPGPQTPPVHHVWTAGPADRRRFTWLSTWRALTQWQLWLVILVVIGFAASRAPSIGAGIGIVIVLLPLFVGMIVALTWFRSYRTLAHTMFPGARWASGFNDFGFMLATPTGTVTVDWPSVVAVGPADGMVVFHTKTGRVGIPSPLVPPPAVDYARSQIARHRPAPQP